MKAVIFSLLLGSFFNIHAMFKLGVRQPDMLAQLGLIIVKFQCPSSGPSGAWLNNEVAWNMQNDGWHEIHGSNRIYYKEFNSMDDAIAVYKKAKKETFLKYCVDQSKQVIAYRAKLKSKKRAESRLTSIEKSIKDLQLVHSELNGAYKELVEMYKHPQINPEYKLAIESLTKRIKNLEDFKRDLENTITP